MKILKRILLTVLVIFVLLLSALLLHPFWMGPLVKTVACKIAPEYTGGEFELADCSINLYKGRVELSGLRVANPPAYGATDAVKVKRAAVQLDVATLGDDVVVVREIVVEEPEAGVYFSGGVNNFTAIGEHAKSKSAKVEETGGAAEEAQEEVEDAAEEAAEQKVIIDLLSISGTVVRLEKLPIPVPPLTLRDIGRKSNGATVADVAAYVWDAICKSAGGLGDLATGLGKSLTDALGGAGNALGDGAKQGVESVNSALKETSEAAAKFFKGLGEGAGEAGADAGAALKDSAKKTREAFKSLGKALKGE